MVPAPRSVVHHPTVGPMLGFESTMELLTAFGVPLAPYVVLRSTDSAKKLPPFPGPYVVKLADLPHRSDIGAVRLVVAPDDLSATVDELRVLAAKLGEPEAVAIQPQFRISSELLVGVDASNDLGPLVVCGVGGVFVEVLRQVTGRLAPFEREEAARLVADVNVGGVLDGPRGTPAWPQGDLAALLASVGDLAVAAHSWLESLDINPLALTPQGIVAVDGLVILKQPPSAVSDGGQQ